MSKHSSIDLGAMEAQLDKNFESHFIKIKNLENIIDDDSDIIFGLKGSGKTTLCRALTELNTDQFLSTQTINLDNLSFSQIHSALRSLEATTKKELIKLASLTWKNVLLLYSVETFAKTLSNDNALKQEIMNMIKNQQYSNDKSNSRILTFIQNLISKINNLGNLDEEDSPLGLTKKQYEEVDKNFSDDLFELIVKVTELLQSRDKKIMVCLDGFDSIIDHSEESRQAIFAGLVDAVYKCSKDELLNPFFCFKVFLPLELTEGVKSAHFDADKYIFNRHFLSWTKNEFKELITKRLGPYSKTHNKTFQNVWEEHFPSKIYNATHKTEEDTFDYILRHTLYRPRHLLIHLQFIFNKWNKPSKVDPSYIPKIVGKTNSSLAALIAAELEYSIPGVTQLLHSWNSISCTTTFGSFRNRLQRMFNISSIEKESKVFDQLYNIGIIGYFKQDQLSNKPKNKMEANFSYTKEHQYDRLVYNTIDPGDIIALSPIFQEYCGCNQAEYGYICQV